ncbi:unnamed protein product, partial [Pylaiella littoralis]
ETIRNTCDLFLLALLSPRRFPTIQLYYWFASCPSGVPQHACVTSNCRETRASHCCGTTLDSRRHRRDSVLLLLLLHGVASLSLARSCVCSSSSLNLLEAVVIVPCILV